MKETDHDPGGKVRLRLRDGVSGEAWFSPCGRYRRLLTRSWDGAERPGSVLWIGMNPSTAAADVDDPTVAKECRFTRCWGYGQYVKANVMDYRATHPRMLLENGVVPCSPDNLPAILGAAEDAALVILAYGALHKRLALHGEAVRTALSSKGVPTFALKLTREGHPGHPLYLRKDSLPFALAS